MNTTTPQNKMKFENGFYMNETAKNDPIVQMAIDSYMKQIKQEAEYRKKLLSGEIEPIPYNSFNISDRD